MSDTIETGEETPSASNAPDSPKTVSKRGRRLLIAIIVVLLLSLVAVTIGMLNYILPRGEIATGDDAGGLEWVRSIYGWGTTPSTQFVDPREVDIASDGTIWVVDSSYGEALAFTPEGKLTNSVGKAAKEPIVGLGPVAEGPDRRVFVGEPDMDRVRVFGADGTDLGMFRIPNPVDITFRDGVLLIGTKFGFSFVNPADGTPIKTVGTFGKGVDQYDNAAGVAIAPDGSTYAVDTYNNRLNAYDSDGQRKWSVVMGAPRNKVDVTGAAGMASSTLTSVPAGLQLPSDVTVDGRGRLVVVDAFDFSISVFDPADGKFIAKYGAYGAEDGKLAYPTSISYDSQRDWFAVADSANQRVQILRIPDSGNTDVLTSARRALSGPIRACLVPLVLLLVAIIVYVIIRARRKRAAKQAKSAKAQAVMPVTEEASATEGESTE